VPDLNKNLFSVGACMSKNYRVIFKDKSVKLFLDNELMAEGVQCDNNLFNMLFKVQLTDDACPVTTTSLRRWHDRLDHVSYKYIRQMNKDGLIGDSTIEDVKKTEDLFCEACQYGKQHRFPFKSREKPGPGELIHSDVCNKMSQESVGAQTISIQPC